MKALILAAGIGSRLAPLTDDKPKSLVEVNGKSILFKQIDNLIENDIGDISIVTGYKSNVLKDAVQNKYPEVKYVESDDYLNTNNMYSAYLGIKALFPHNDIEPFLMMNADVFYDSIIVKDLLNNPNENMIAVDKGVYNDESMKIIVEDGKVRNISKKIFREDAYGCSIDVYKFGSIGGEAFFTECKKYIDGKKIMNMWSEVALDNILSNVTFVPSDIKGRWMEIDNHDDLAMAEKIFI